MISLLRGSWRREGPRRRRFQQLQWKLMRSYVVVTVSAVLIVYLLLWALAGYTASQPILSTQELTMKAKAISAQIARPLGASSPDTTRIAEILRSHLNGNYRMSASVANLHGTVLVCVPEWSGKVGTSLFQQASPEIKALAHLALASKGASARLSTKDMEGNSLAAVPVLSAKQQVVGLLFIEISAPINLRDFSRGMFMSLLTIAFVVGFFAAVVGLGFGFLTARQLTRRLKAIADAADAWSQGEFSAVAHDDSEDELGQLARRLNHMAYELRELVVLRQNLATSEERNRLSRELHDTVKQQVFATTMQVGAARVLLDRDIDLARARLVEGERLASEAQHELTTILEQLRPGSYLPTRKSNENLESMLHAYTRDWSRHSGIAADVMAEPIIALPPTTQEALLRITQEALANVARHSRATKIQVQLNMSPLPTTPLITPIVQNGVTHDVLVRQRIMLTIQDNGCGFDPLQGGGGLGLQIMRERAEALPFGTLVVDSRGGHPTRVEVTCSAPYEAESDGE